MRRITALFLAAVMSVGLLTGCGEKTDVQSEASVSWSETTRYEIGGIEFSLPKSAKENTEEDQNISVFRSFDCDDFGFSCQFFENQYVDNEEKFVTREYHVIEESSCKVNSISCRYFLLLNSENYKVNSNKADEVKLYVNSERGNIVFSFYDNDNVDHLVKSMNEFSKTIKYNVAYEDVVTTKKNFTTTQAPKKTTTTTETTTKSMVDEFYDLYGNCPTWRDVKYDPYSYNNSVFIVEYAELSLSDYYNYDYRDTENKYFCIRVKPYNSRYSDWLYVYADRNKFSSLYDILKSKDTTGYIAAHADSESLTHDLATLDSGVWYI